MEPKFIVDNNAGKLARWLRVMGYDTLFFKGEDDGRMLTTAFTEGRVILTKDAQILKRRVVATGKLKVVFIKYDDPKAQLRQIVRELGLGCSKPFSLCLECNETLLSRNKEEVQNLVPPYVFKTQNQYMECPKCHRIYWRGTHWRAMARDLQELCEFAK